MSSGQKAFNEMRKDVENKIRMARSEGFVEGYFQVYADELIEAYQLIEGLAYWDLSAKDHILNNPDFDWISEDQRSEIIEALEDEDQRSEISEISEFLLGQYSRDHGGIKR